MSCPRGIVVVEDNDVGAAQLLGVFGTPLWFFVWLASAVGVACRRNTYTPQIVGILFALYDGDRVAALDRFTDLWQSIDQPCVGAVRPFDPVAMTVRSTQPKVFFAVLVICAYLLEDDLARGITVIVCDAMIGAPIGALFRPRPPTVIASPFHRTILDGDAKDSVLLVRLAPVARAFWATGVVAAVALAFEAYSVFGEQLIERAHRAPRWAPDSKIDGLLKTS
jgi:hypothetical protein